MASMHMEWMAVRGTAMPNSFFVTLDVRLDIVAIIASALMLLVCAFSLIRLCKESRATSHRLAAGQTTRKADGRQRIVPIWLGVTLLGIGVLFLAVCVPVVVFDLRSAVPDAPNVVGALAVGVSMISGGTVLTVGLIAQSQRRAAQARSEAG